jgi:hypothetical protein
MKKIAMLMVVGVVAGLLSGCATPYPMGSIYTDLSLPVAATSNTAVAPKMGTSESTSILALIAIGDNSIETAARAGGIKKIYYVDHKVKNILGVYGVYTTIVYGE